MQVIDPSLDRDSGVFALGYGGSGTGKTHLAATAGELGYTLLIDVDQGYKTVINGKGITEQMRDNVVIATFDSFTDLNTAYKATAKNDPATWVKLLDPKGTRGVVIDRPFDWIIWDTWSELQWYMMQQLRKNENLLSANMGQDIEFRKNVGIQHWGMLTDLNKLAIEQLRAVTKASGVNQLFLMQEKVDKDDVAGTIIKGPAIHGKLVTEMPAYFDIVIHTGTTPTGAWTATTKPKMGWPAKTRLGEGVELTNPTMKQILGL